MEKFAKKWIFPKLSFKTLKFDKIYPDELRSRLYKVLIIEGKATIAFKLTETSKKSKFMKKNSKNFKYFEKITKLLSFWLKIADISQFWLTERKVASDLFEKNTFSYRV